MSDAKKKRRRPLKESALRAWRESVDDDVFGRAAQLSYYFLLALFPLLIFFTGVIGYMRGVQNNFLNGLARVLPPDAMKLVRDTLDDVIRNRSGGLVSIGLIGALWAASSGVSSLIDTLNTAYDLKERRPFWKRRLVAIGLTIAMALLVIGGSALIVVGHRLGSWLVGLLEVSAAVGLISSIVSYLIGLGLLLIGIILLYRFGPDLKHGEKPILPGALFAAFGIVAGSLLFSLYVRVAPSASATYGSLGAVVTLMLWLYLMGLVLLMGAEINSEMEERNVKSET